MKCKGNWKVTHVPTNEIVSSVFAQHLFGFPYPRGDYSPFSPKSTFIRVYSWLWYPNMGATSSSGNR
jgi:hypothetical protein